MALFRVNVYDSNDELDKNIVSEGIAGENISSGDLCYLNNDGKFWKANASSINRFAIVGKTLLKQYEKRIWSAPSIWKFRLPVPVI